MCSKAPAVRVVFLVATLLATLTPVQGLLNQAVRGGEKADLSAAFVVGSVWKGEEIVTRPKPDTSPLELTVLERDGEKYTAVLVWPTKNYHRTVEGTIKQDGRLTWKGAAGAPNPGHPHDGRINGHKIEFKITPKGDGVEAHGAFNLATPPEKYDPTTLFIKGSVWQGDEVVTKPKPHTTIWEFSILERNGDKFTAQMHSKDNFRRRVEGTIKPDGSFTWKGTDEKNLGHPHNGKINGSKIEFKITPKGDGVEAHGAFTLVMAGPRYDQIRQGSGPTCWINASMAAVQYSGYDLPGQIQGKGNNRYEVKLYNLDDPKKGTAAGLHETIVQVDFDGKTLPADPKVKTGDKAAIWTVVYQRAVIEAVRQWDPTQSIEKPHGGGGDVIGMMTGRPPVRISAKAADARQKVESALEARKAVIYGMGTHYWAVLKSSSESVTAYNPYGHTQVFTWELVRDKGRVFFVAESKGK
jgi:hypothetical protein